MEIPYCSPEKKSYHGVETSNSVNILMMWFRAIVDFTVDFALPECFYYISHGIELLWHFVVFC